MIAAVLAAMAFVYALGVRAAVVLSSGFGESGADGVALEREVAAIARRHDMAVVGPNSVGVVHVPGRLSLSFSEALVRGSPRSGGIGMVSQSGAFGTVLFATAQSRGLGLHTYVSSGNEAVVGFADHIEVLVAGRHAASGDYRRIRRLMTERPHQYTIASSDDRRLGAALVAEGAADGVTLTNGTLAVQTSDFGRFVHALPRLARDAGVRLLDVSPADESLESVFAYLVAR